MRILLAMPFIALLAPRLDACSCSTPGTPCHAAGIAAAAFTGTVLNITFYPAQPVPADNARPAAARRLSAPALADGGRALSRAFFLIRIQVEDVLSGIDPGQREIEVVTGLGEADCGYPFQSGMDYVVYASKNAEGQLATGICSRTRPLAQAAEDLRYFHAMAGAPATGEMRVFTRQPGLPSRSGVSIVAEREGLRYRAQTNAAGDATFTGLPPGEYSIHVESDGDLPDDPKVQLYAKGCREVFLLRTLRIIGRVMTKDGMPAARVEVEVRSTSQTAADMGRMTTPDGYYELPITRPGQYYLGINLNHTPTRDTPYPRWFYPGTKDQASAAIINFSGKPDTPTYNFTLPDRQDERVIEGIVFTSDGRPMAQARVTVFDSSETVIAFDAADPGGRFRLRVFAGIPYRLHAMWPGDTPDKAVSAVPTDIQPGSSPVSLQLVLSQRGNSVLDAGRKGPGDNGEFLRR